MIRYCVEYDPVKHMTHVTYRADNGPIKNRIYPGRWHGRWVSPDDETVFVQTRSEVIKDITITKEEGMTNRKDGYASIMYAYDEMIRRGANIAPKTTHKPIAMPFIKKVIFNDPATIVIWSDDTKTVVKTNNERFDPEKGLAMAIVKRMYNNKGNYYNEFKKHIDYEKLREEEKEQRKKQHRNNVKGAVKLLTLYENDPKIIKAIVDSGVDPNQIVKKRYHTKAERVSKE